MSKSLEQRVAALEKEVAELKKAVQPARTKAMELRDFIGTLKRCMVQVSRETWLNAEI